MSGTWPDWTIDKSKASQLARYVLPARTQDLGLIPADCFSPWTNFEEGMARAGRLYGELRDRRIAYSHEPWNPARFGEDGTLSFQRVRPPYETIQGPATCLDLALVFAGMAVAAGMRPLIGLQTAPNRHALVVLDLQAARSRQRKEGSGDVPPGFASRPGEPGVWDLAEAGAPPGAQDWLIIDVARAARHRPSLAAGRLLPEEGAPFGAATLTPNVWGDAGQTWTLVDVDRALNGAEAHEPPTGRSVPAIYGYLPALPSFIDYETRRKLLRDLHGMVGPEQSPAVIVLYGPPGRGKSMLAHRLAVAADHNCGWFLNATDDKVLTRSLAQAERQEKDQREGRLHPAAAGEKPDAGEDRAFASTALSRLRDAERPWVVVLDNCDSAPGIPRLRELIPRPRRAGQFVIITTTDERWAAQAQASGWHARQVPPLEPKDLTDLGLPAGLDGAVNGRPLIAQALAALSRPGAVVLPGQVEADGPDLVWDLLRGSRYASHDMTSLARLLAWCPPEFMDVTSLLPLTGLAADPAVGRRLADLGFVTPDAADAGLAIQMHRLFAAAVRSQTWRDDPAAAADVIGRLLTDEKGRALFIDAADNSALGRLERGQRSEPGDAGRAADVLAGSHQAGLLWYGLGHIRERRGPVAESARHFQLTAKTLDRQKFPFAVAESLIGQARVVFQDKQSSNDQLVEARALVEQGRQLLAPLPEDDAQQMREQGNALSWLIAQVMAARERDPRKREALLAEVRENLWLSYEERLRLVRGPDAADVSRRTQPEPSDKLGAERAYYNLAGVNIQLAKTHYELAHASDSGAPLTASDQHGKWLAEAGVDLAEAAGVYERVRALREQRYAGRPHPHLASCVHGQAVVAYFTAVLLGQTGKLAEAFAYAAEAMEQRRKIASGFAGLGDPAVLDDGDVRKSHEFMMKVTIAGVYAASGEPGAGAGAVMGVVREAFGECLGRATWTSQPGVSDV